MPAHAELPQGALLLVSSSPVRLEALRLLLFHHADIPVITAFTPLEVSRRLSSTVCRAILLDLTVLQPSTLLHAQRLSTHAAGIPLGILLSSWAAAYAPTLLRSGARVLLDAETSLEEFLVGIGALLRGESFLSPPFAESVRKALTENLPHHRLSSREWQILLLLLQGKTYAQIGRLLGIGSKTASTYWHRIARKLGCSTRADLFHYAYTHKLLPEPTAESLRK
jgi:DNA-binding NarL/FixJ family response regulator